MSRTAAARTGVLFLESSAGSHGVLGVDSADGREFLRASLTRPESRQDNLDDLVGAMAAPDLANLGTIVVDAGPGNLATTRACVAYANALAYATGCAMGRVDSLEVMSRLAAIAGESMLAVRRAGPHGFYARLRDHAGQVRYELLDAARAADAVAEASLTVYANQPDASALEDAGVDMARTRLVAPTVEGVRELWLAEERAATSRVVEPITESGAIFDGSP